MRKQRFATYGAVAAVTLVAAAVLAACEPASVSMTTPDWSSALDWAQMERAGAITEHAATPADAARVAHRPDRTT